jgi:hypothetical protein
MTFPVYNESTGHSLFGMPVKVSKFIPDDVFMAVDPAGDADKTAIVEMKTGSVRTLKEIYDDLPADGDTLSEDIQRAMEKLRANDYATFFGSVTTSNVTTSNVADDTNVAFDMLKMMDIIEQARIARFEQDKSIVNALINSGFTVTCNEFTHRPVAILPEDFSEALEAVLEERKRRVL